jgi:hypothetical protein
MGSGEYKRIVKPRQILQNFCKDLRAGLCWRESIVETSKTKISTMNSKFSGFIFLIVILLPSCAVFTTTEYGYAKKDLQHHGRIAEYSNPYKDRDLRNWFINLWVRGTYSGILAGGVMLSDAK